MKKLLAMATSLALLATSAIVPMTAAAAEEKEVTKPEKITIMVDTTLVNQANGRDAFEARWEELTGIDLVINQPDHSAYYDVMQQTMADPDQWPDVLIMSSTYYSDFAANGALWDMTEAWENSNTKNSGRFTGDSVIEGLKINGHLYGFSPARGNGCVTYVKKAWMDKAGITKAPTIGKNTLPCSTPSLSWAWMARPLTAPLLPALSATKRPTPTTCRNSIRMRIRLSSSRMACMLMVSPSRKWKLRWHA